MQKIYLKEFHLQPRQIQQIVSALNDDQLVVIPTDTSYVFVARTGHKGALDRIARIRQLDEKHQYTLLCQSLSDVSTYAKLNNDIFRLLKAHTPSKATFILPATPEVPKRLQHPKKKTIGIRVSNAPVVEALLQELNEPLLVSTLILPDDEFPLDDPEEIENQIGKQIDLLVDGGILSRAVTTIIDCTSDGQPVLVRQGDEDVDNWW